MIRAALILLAMSTCSAMAQADRGPPGERWNGQRWDGRDRPIQHDGGGLGGGLPTDTSVKYDPIHNPVDRDRGRYPVTPPGHDPYLKRLLREYENRP